MKELLQTNSKLRNLLRNKRRAKRVGDPMYYQMQKDFKEMKKRLLNEKSI